MVSEEEKQKIAAQVETFRTEKSKFDREVAKWDDTGNDVIVLAKQMCMIMMEMTDFTRFVLKIYIIINVLETATDRKLISNTRILQKCCGKIIFLWFRVSINLELKKKIWEDFKFRNCTWFLYIILFIYEY